jgi:DNA-binding CsgD family transcriptional regulator/PAS domain-containing protein
VSSIENKALALIEPIYAATTDRQQWPHLIEAITNAVGGQGGMLRLTDYTNRKVGFFEASGYEVKFLHAYRDYFISIDPFRQFYERTPVGMLLRASQLQDYGSIRNSEFHNDYNRPQNKEFIAGATLARNNDVTLQFGVHRRKRAGDFGQEDMQLLRLLLPHLTRAVQVHRLIGETAVRADMAYASLDKARIGIFLMDADGYIQHINREGEKLLVSGKLAVAHKKLALTNTGDTAQLHQLIASAACPTLGKTLLGGGNMRLRSTQGKIDLELRVIPMSGRDDMAGLSIQAGCVAVFVSHHGTLRLPWKKVASIFGLSPAEAKLAVILAEGCGPEEAAERLSISVHTARVQLRSIFAKTETNRQSQLVSLLLSGVLAWCAE